MSYFAKHPELAGQTVPLTYYGDAYFEKERKHVFRKSWLNSGWRVEDIAAKGAFFKLPLAIANTVILVIRGDDDVIRGFHNMCTHRGNQVELHDCGEKQRFICGFHNWTFDTKGKLVGAPGSKTIPGFDKSKYGLKAIHVETWNGFIFFSLEEPATSLKEYLGEWGSDLDGYPFDRLELASHYESTVHANWKILLDAFQEAFHVPFLHSKSQADAAETGNPLASALDIKLYNNHRRLSFPADQSSVSYSQSKSSNPARPLPPITSQLVSFGRLGVLPEFAPEHFPPGVNPTRSGRWAFDLNVVYPNWWIAVRGDYVHIYNFWPLTATSTRYDVRFYYSKPRSVKERLFHEMRRLRVRNTLMEDLSTVERTQQMLGSGACDHSVLTDEEILIAHHRYSTDKIIKIAQAATGE